MRRYYFLSNSAERFPDLLLDIIVENKMEKEIKN
jgi:hypothetical protein